MKNYKKYMLIAIDEAKISLQEGNCGFGAVVVKDNNIIVKAHDTEKTTNDPTAHAELNAIKTASSQLGRDLNGCLLISTHEPCPMCATAIVWAGIKKVGYGYSIKEAIGQGRKRIDLSCREIFECADSKVTIYEDLLKDECAILYNEDVRDEIKKFRGINKKKLTKLEYELSKKRSSWFKINYAKHRVKNEELLHQAYDLFIRKLGISPTDAPIIKKSKNMLVIHSKNFCPTLEACKILGLDTKLICSSYSEKPAETLLKQLNSKLRFGRNYEKIRPLADYCEEMISIKDV